MFEQTMVDGVKRGSPWSFAASITMQSAMVGAVLVLPMMQVAKLTTRPPDVLFLPKSIGPHEPVKQAPAQGGATSSTAILNAGKTYKIFRAPIGIPKEISMAPDLPGAPIYEPTGGGGPGGSGGGFSGPVLDLPAALPVPPPPAPKAPAKAAKPSGPVPIGGDVQAAKLIFSPRPVYPPLARQARISGSVRLAAVISRDGRVQNLRLISGHPMLTQAAIEAVRQWVYQPTLLNKEPVEVLTDIEVNFVLQ